MAYKLDGTTIAYGTPFKKGDLKYTRAWWTTSSTSEKNSLGVTEVADPTPYDARFYINASTGKPLADLKAEWVKLQKEQAGKLLADTDWMVLRAAGGGTAVPSATTTKRANIRTVSGERETQINAAANVAALKTLIDAAQTIAGTADNGATEKKDGSGYSYDPKQYEEVQNPAGLKAWPTA